nr:peptidase G2 autoproteolytic cleavage domain-containing protein [Magnetofaba australis]
MFRIESGGNVYAKGSINANTADFGELMEWEDGNPDNEDRVGLPVVRAKDVDGQPNGKVRIATLDDDPNEIFGVMSGTAILVGNTFEDEWAEKDLRDAYGRILTEPCVQLSWQDENGERVFYHEDRIPESVFIPDLIIDQDDPKPTTTDPETGKAVNMSERLYAVRRTRNSDGQPLMRNVQNPAYDASRAYIGRQYRPEWDVIGFLGQIHLRADVPVNPRWMKLQDAGEGVEVWLVR